MAVGQQPGEHEFEDRTLSDDCPFDLGEDRIGARADVAERKLCCHSASSR